MKAVVLAGGFGTRLRPLTFARPKHMLPIVDKPMLEHIVEYLDFFEVFDEIIISIGKKEGFEKIIEHFHGKSYGTKISFVKEKERLGGVGAIKYAIETKKIDEPFVLYLGDNITNFDLKEMIEFYEKDPVMISVALKKANEPWKYGVAVMDGTDVKKFVEKPPIGKEPSDMVSTGIYIIDPKINDYLNYDFLDSTGMLFPIILNAGHRITGYDMKNSFWVDVGRPASYLEATAYALEKLGIDNWIEKGVKVGKGTKFEGPVVIYDKGTKIGKNCLIKNSVIFSNNEIGNDCHIVNSIIDEDCKISDGIHISTTLGRGSILGKKKEE